jgi:hypothetical protein
MKIVDGMNRIMLKALPLLLVLLLTANCWLLFSISNQLTTVNRLIGGLPTCGEGGLRGSDCLVKVTNVDQLAAFIADGIAKALRR